MATTSFLETLVNDSSMQRKVYRVNALEPGALMKHVITKTLNEAMEENPSASVVAGPLLVHGGSRIGLFRLRPLGRLGPVQNGACAAHVFVLDGAKTLATALAVQIEQDYISRLTQDMSLVVQPLEKYAVRNCNTTDIADIVIFEADGIDQPPPKKRKHRRHRDTPREPVT